MLQAGLLRALPILLALPVFSQGTHKHDTQDVCVHGGVAIS